MKVQHPIVPLEQVVSLVKRGETPKEGVIYRQIGVRLWGKGSYERESMDGGGTKYKTLYKVKAADLIVNKIWARNGSVAVITAEVDGSFVSAEFPTFELNKKKILPRWLHWITKTPILWDQFDEKSHGTSGKNRIQPNKILLAKIPLPDIEKQKYLLVLIEDIAVRHEKLTNLHEISLGDVQRLRQAILQEAVQGKLIPQDPNDEPASELLKRIKTEKEKLIAEGKIKKQKPLPPINKDETPYELPDGWEWVKLGNIVQVSSGDGLTLKNMDTDGTIPVYGGNGITGYHNKYNVNKQTIVIGRVGYYCGSIHLTQERAWVTDNAFITKFPETYIDQGFLIWLLKGTDLKKNENATAQPVISGRKIYPIIIGIPPLAEQKRIVSKVDQLMQLCDELENRLNQSEKDSEMLMHAVLQEAFAIKQA